MVPILWHSGSSIRKFSKDQILVNDSNIEITLISVESLYKIVYFNKYQHLIKSLFEFRIPKVGIWSDAFDV